MIHKLYVATTHMNDSITYYSNNKEDKKDKDKDKKDTYAYSIIKSRYDELYDDNCISLKFSSTLTFYKHKKNKDKKI